MDFFHRKYFRDLVTLERLLQVEKKRLGLHSDFSHEACAGTFYLTPSTRLAASHLNKLFPNYPIESIELVVARYDTDED